MEENKYHFANEKNEYIFKILYLIRKNLPKSEFIYLLMFGLKYIGLILFSISLNVFDSDDISSNFEKPMNEPDGNHEPPPSDNIMERVKPNSSNSFSDSNNIIQKIFKKLLINGDNLNILNHSYQIICLIGFIILIIYIFLWIFGYFYMKNKYFNKNLITVTDRKIKKINQSSTFEKKYFKVLTYFLFLIIFFHQYIYEYYIFGFIGYIINLSGYESEEQNSVINNHFQNLIFPEILIIIINFITIFILLVLFAFFILINSSKTMYINNNYPLHSNQINLLLNMIILNINPFLGLLHIFNNSVKLKIGIVFIIIILALIVIKTTVNNYYFFPLPYKLKNLCIFIEFFCFFASIINLITYLTKSEINSSKFSIIKFIFELLNATLFSFLYIRKTNEKNMKIFSTNLFSTNYKNLNPSAIYYYFSCYLKYLENKENNYMTIFKPIQNHVLSCSKKECPGNILLPKSLSYSIFTDFEHYSQIKSSEDEKSKDSIMKKKESKVNNDLQYTDINKDKEKLLKSKKSKEIRKNNNRKNSANIKNKSNNEIEINEKEDLNIIYNKKTLEDNEFKMIGEQEIINRINFLYRRKKTEYLQIYIFIHLQYIIKIKQNYRLALYYLGKYSFSEIKYSLLSRYYFYEIKKYIHKNIFDKRNTNLIKDPYIIKYKGENIKLKQLIDYTSLFNIIRKILKTSCENIIQFYSFRRELRNFISLQKYKKIKIYSILSSSEKIQNSIFNLEFLLKKINKDNKHNLESIELSYLICNFFKLLYGRIPQEILNNVNPILNFRDNLYDQLVNEFHIFMMKNPLILSLTKKDTFNISYFTNIFLKKLGYTFADLKNKDFHEKLFPGGEDLIKEHSLILKQFLFFYKNSYSKCNSFIKSKEGYLVSINFNCKVFPTFMSEFLLIANIIFNDELSNDNNSTKEKNINTNNSNNNFQKEKTSNNNKIINSYSFMLNNNYEILGLTKNFYMEYNLNQGMFRELRINFCQFFCVDENKLSKRINSERKKIIKDNPHLNNQISLKEASRAYTIFQNISMKNLFKIREEKILETYNYPDIFIYEKIEKKKLIKKIPEIINMIDEIGLDYDWYIRLENYKERLGCNRYIDNKINLNNNEKKFTYYSQQNFEVVFSLKKMGALIYFVVNLNEIFDKDIKALFKEQRASLKKNINKASRKITTDSTLKSKNKSPGANSRKSLSINNLKNYNKLQSMNDNELKSGKNKNISATQINIKIPKLEEKNETKIDDKNDKKNETSNKNIQNNSIFDNSEYLKNLKNKKSLNEDEENVPLITKSKFNEELAKKEKRNKIFIFILFILIIISFILAVSKTIESLSSFKENLHVLSIAIDFEMLKVDIYVHSILTLIYCINEDKITDPNRKSVMIMIQKMKLAMLIKDLNLVQDEISIILNNKNSFSIFSSIEERFLIKSLENDWEKSNRTVDLLEETRRLSYVIGSALESEDDKCNFSIFYEISKEGYEGFKGSKDKKPSFKQKLLFYFIYNIFTAYKNSFDKLSDECSSALEIMWKEYQNVHLYLVIAILSALFAFIIIYFIKYCLDNSFYQLLFLYYYNIENEHKKFETQIYYLYKTTLEFNFENIKYFEYIKSNIGSNDLFEFSNKITNNQNNKKENIQKGEKKINLEQNSLNGSLLNSSMNGSSIQFLNNSNKFNLNNKFGNSNNKNFGNKIESKEENKISQEENIESLMKFISDILPSSRRISLIFILISLLIYIGACIYGVFNIYEQIDEYKFSIYLSMNILERVPRLIELVLYSIVTIILNKTELISATSEQSSYLKYFQINSLYYSQEMMDTYFKNNFYGNILKDNLKLKYNLENYLYGNKYGIFKNVQKWEDLLNTLGSFCINYAVGGVFYTEGAKSLSEYDSFYDILEQVNSNSQYCKSETAGIKDSGIKIETNFLLQEITSRYIEFIDSDKSTEEKLDKARANFIFSKNVVKIFNNAKMYFVTYFNIITKALKDDFDEQHKYLANEQIITSAIFLLINIEILIGLIISIMKEEKYKKQFKYFSTIPKEEIINL